MSKLSNADVIVQNDIKRYKKNSSASNLVYLALVFLILYFLILYANRVGNRTTYFVENGVETKILGSSSVYSYLFGIDVILNLCVLLFGFYTGVKLGGYSKTYSYVAYVLAAIEIARIFLIPYWYLNQTTSNDPMLTNYDFTWLVVMLVLSAACFVVAGVLGYVRADKREKFQKSLDDGEIDLEAALKDENDVLSKDESPVDIFDEDLDGKKEVDEKDGDTGVSIETTNLGGDV